MRFRFALAYAALLAGTGIVLIALFYGYVRAVGLAQPGTRPLDPVPAAPAPTIEPEPSDPFVGNAIFISLAVLVILAAMGIGWLVAGRLLRPLGMINDAAVRVGSGDLTRRVELAGPDDEFENLARALNTMLDRLHDSLDAHRRFAANASHELRTPLATNKAILAVALDDPDDTDLIELARQLQATNQDNIDTVEALLDLTDAQYGLTTSSRLDLAALSEEELTAALPDIGARRIHVARSTAPALTFGDAVLWRRLVTNLLRNAIQYNHDQGTIWVTTGSDDGRAFIEVANTGDALDPAHVATFTEPFVRAQGRTRSADSTNRGLGLAIVASVATAHDADLTLTARGGGGLLVRVLAP